MTKDGSTKIVNSMTDPGGRGSCARAWPCKSYSENALSSTLLIYRTMIAIEFRDNDVLSYAFFLL